MSSQSEIALSKAVRRLTEDIGNHNQQGVREFFRILSVDLNAKVANSQYISRNVNKGVVAWQFSRAFDLCWPLKARYYVNEGGVYYRGALRSASALSGVRVLAEMAVELEAARPKPPGGGPSGLYAGEEFQPILWPVPKSKYSPIENWRAHGNIKFMSALEEDQFVGQFKYLCKEANNIIANYLAIARSYESRTARARDTLSICTSRLESGAGTVEPVLIAQEGALMGLGSNGPTIKIDEDFMMYYYLKRYPAIAVYLPSAPTSASELANILNTKLGELISYCRTTREELRLLLAAHSKCLQGLRPAPVDPARPPTGGLPDPSTVSYNPDGTINYLPSPYDNVPVSDAGLTDEEQQQFEDLMSGGTGQKKPLKTGTMAMMLVGLALLARRT
jgi:hypothetical protein